MYTDKEAALSLEKKVISSQNESYKKICNKVEIPIK